MIRDYLISNILSGLKRTCIRLLYVPGRKFIKASLMKLNLKKKKEEEKAKSILPIIGIKLQQCRATPW